jgi:hypothetical protein
MSRFFRLHSGGVVRNGSGVLFVGPSGAGKSTLVLRLLAEEFALLSDDEVWIDPESLLVYPSTRPILLKDSAWDFFPAYRHRFIEYQGEERAWWLHPDDVRRDCRAAPSPVRAAIFLESRSSDRPFLEDIGQTEAVTRLLHESMNLSDFGSTGLSLLVRLVKSARLFKLNNGDLDACTRMLRENLP